MKTTLLFFALLLPLQAGAAAVVHQYRVPRSHTEPGSLVFTADGRGWIASNSGYYYRVETDGTFVELGKEQFPATSNISPNLILGPDGAPWGRLATQIYRIDPVTSNRTYYPVDGTNLIDMFFNGGDGTIWILTSTGDNQSRLVRINTSGQVVSSSDIPNSEFEAAYGAMAPDGTLWIAQVFSIVRITASGEQQTFPVTVQYPWLMVPASDDSMWVTGLGNEVVRLSLSGQVLLRLQITFEPRAVAVDVEGNLWLFTYPGSVIRKITPAGVITEEAYLPDPTDSLQCDYDLMPMVFMPNGLLAVLKYGRTDSAIPEINCANEPRAVDDLFILDPAAHGGADVPALSAYALMIFAGLIGLAAVRLLRM